MKISDLLVDSNLLFYDQDKNQYYTLKYHGSIEDGFDDLPVTIILTKNKRVYKKDLLEYKDNDVLQRLNNLCKDYNMCLEDIPDILEEYISYDNQEYLDKLKNQKL